MAERDAFLDTLKQAVPQPGCPLLIVQPVRRMEIRICDPEQEINIEDLHATEGIALDHYADTLTGDRTASTRIMLRFVEIHLYELMGLRTGMQRTLY